MSFASTILSLRSLSACAGVLAHITAGFAGAAHGETATMAGHEMYYEVHGDLSSGETPVLMLHGGMMTIETTFAALIPRLSALRPVITVEQQGHGHTGDRDGPITLESMRTDTARSTAQAKCTALSTSIPTEIPMTSSSRCPGTACPVESTDLLNKRL